MNKIEAATYIKLFIGLVLFGTWIALVYMKVTGVEDIIMYIKLGLTGLGFYHMGQPNQTAPTVVNLTQGSPIAELQPMRAVQQTTVASGLAISPVTPTP